MDDPVEEAPDPSHPAPHQIFHPYKGHHLEHPYLSQNHAPRSESPPSFSSVLVLLCQSLPAFLCHLSELTRIMSFLRGEIAFAVSTLPEAMQQIQKRTTPPFTEFFANLSENMQQSTGEEFQELLQKQMNYLKKNSALTTEDLETFSQTAGHLGYLDKEMQLHLLDRYLQEQQETIKTLQKQLPDKKRVVRSIGILAGVLLLVLFL